MVSSIFFTPEEDVQFDSSIFFRWVGNQNHQPPTRHLKLQEVLELHQSYAKRLQSLCAQHGGERRAFEAAEVGDERKLGSWIVALKRNSCSLVVTALNGCPANRDWCPAHGFSGGVAPDLHQRVADQPKKSGGLDRPKKVDCDGSPVWGLWGWHCFVHDGNPFLSNRFFTKTNIENESEAKQVSGAQVETFCWLFWQGMKALRKVLVMILIKIKNNDESSCDLHQS